MFEYTSTKGIIELVNRRRDRQYNGKKRKKANNKKKQNKTQQQTIIYKGLHRKIKIEHHTQHKMGEERIVI
jgi:hypothetical protein